MTQWKEGAPEPHLDLLVLESTDLVFLPNLNYRIDPLVIHMYITV